jgi:hypothetical protein
VSKNLFVWIIIRTIELEYTCGSVTIVDEETQPQEQNQVLWKHLARFADVVQAKVKICQIGDKFIVKQ